ncbi:MAG: hypothetical protein M3283_08400 [Actinomycetota bacterium]|nr:hypothetical protein [Actinomycetota bacterium]
MTDEDVAGSRSEPEPPAPDRYYAERVAPASGGGGLALAEIQEAMNEGSRKSWRLVGVVDDPAGQGVILVWDQEGFISG